MAKIEDALPYVLQNEGGEKYTNHPNDPGGPTKWGVTLATLSSWRHQKCTAQDVMDLTKEEATRIYKAHYWDVLGLDSVNDQRIATGLFDVAVNRGPAVAREYAGFICNLLGKRSVNECDPLQFMSALERRVERGYESLAAKRPRLRVFLKGWLNRARRLLTLFKRKP